MVSRTKYRKAADLYVVGTEVELQDGVVMWVQALNPFEYDEAQRTAAAARSRFQLAMREYGSDELSRFQAQANEMPRDVKVDRVADVKAQEVVQKAIAEIEADEEWAEVRAVLDREEELIEGSEEEKKLLSDKNQAYIKEVGRRVDDEREYLKRTWAKAPDEELDEALKELWIDHIANERGMREYEIAEIFMGSRACEGVIKDDGTWDHSACEGHRLTAFEDKDEVKALPAEMYGLIRDGFGRLNMHPMDPKGSGSPVSSSEPSATPSTEEDSPSSTPAETSETAPGTSTQQSAKP